MVCEELTSVINANGDGYHDLGWVIEIDPATRSVINQDGIGGVDKLWAMGNQSHENVTIKPDQSVVYYGADDGTYGYVYKFVPAVPGNYSSGELFVLKTTGLGSGTWSKIPNTTKDERNNVQSASVAAGAYNFNRVEDMELGPDGKLYFACTSGGNVFRLKDNGSAVSDLEIFVATGTYNIEGVPATFSWPDNLAFGNEGNLWVLQDGGDNHIWVVAPEHTTAAPALRVFANTPLGSEPTGITFSPDNRFMFLSIQHPNGSNTQPQADAAGNDVAFDDNTVIVIARKENLGTGAVLPLRFIDIHVQQSAGGVTVLWKINNQENALAFTIGRSADGIHFDKVGMIKSDVVNTLPLTYTDEMPPAAVSLYYRVKVCDATGQCLYSEVKTVKWSVGSATFSVIAQYSGSVVILFLKGIPGQATIKILATDAGK